MFLIKSAVLICPPTCHPKGENAVPK